MAPLLFRKFPRNWELMVKMRQTQPLSAVLCIVCAALLPQSSGWLIRAELSYVAPKRTLCLNSGGFPVKTVISPKFFFSVFYDSDFVTSNENIKLICTENKMGPIKEIVIQEPEPAENYVHVFYKIRSQCLLGSFV